MKYKAALMAFGALTVIAGVTLMTSSKPTEAAKPTPEFIQQAASSNMFEIESSKVALERSQNTAVKEFAQKMIDDHTKTGQEMKAALATVGMETPEGDRLNEKHQKLLEQLTDAEATQFDKEYIYAQVMAHNEAVELFKDYAENGDQDVLQEFAMHTLPVLQTHKDHIQGLNFSQ